VDVKRRISHVSPSTQWPIRENGEGVSVQDIPRKGSSSTSFSRGSSPAGDDDEAETDVTVGEKTTMRFTIGDRLAVDAFYDNTFHCVQQLALKAILKAWIKIWDPNKQKQFPYTLGVRPDYWPKHIRYQEPDHILKVGPSLRSPTVILLIND
jgi:hypothetical protein